MSWTTSDPLLLQCEYHNRGKYRIKFTRLKENDQYVLLSGKKNLGPEIAFLEPEGFLYLPHSFYLIEGIGMPKGEPIELLRNTEKAMFKGNKTPSNQYGLGE